jgi:hypothetical protein
MAGVDLIARATDDPRSPLGKPESTASTDSCLSYNCDRRTPVCQQAVKSNEMLGRNIRSKTINPAFGLLVPSENEPLQLYQEKKSLVHVAASATRRGHMRMFL